MPRKIQGPDELAAKRPTLQLSAVLAEELAADRDSGQPWIDEQRFKNGLVKVSVLWDRWDDVADEDRTRAILDAYRIVEGEDFTRTIALATGLTFSEAYALGLLPYQIITARRRDDPVTLDQLHEAMIQQGASTLINPKTPQLRFALLNEAEACLRRLVAQLPASEQVWQITQEVGQVVAYS